MTTTFVGAHYELTNGTVTKYYLAGASRIAARNYTVPQVGVLTYLLSDHLGSNTFTGQYSHVIPVGGMDDPSTPASDGEGYAGV